MRGSKEAHNRRYEVKGSSVKCKRGCRKAHPDNLCPKNPGSPFHPRNLKATENRRIKEAKQQDKQLTGKGDGCFGVFVLVAGSVAAGLYGLARVVGLA